MTEQNNIAGFWRAFAEQESAFTALPLQERVEQGNALLEAYIDGLALEISGEPNDAVVDLILTAHGTVENFPLLLQTVAVAPLLKCHAVRAFRERTEQAEFSIDMNGFDLATSDVLIACEPDSGKVALNVRFKREIPQDFQDNAQHIAFIMLDHVLGEYDFAVKVGGVDFVEDDFEPDTDWKPLPELPALFDQLWIDHLGRSGDFPVGEYEWRGLRLTFGGPNAEAGDGPKDVAIVAVNLSANAVAMRADLSLALTLDLAGGNNEEVAAAQDLQDQAATLLELPQLGILAFTMVRGDRRKAVYYVSHEKLAKQALAPLLLRDEAASLALTTAYDPSWSGYFEFASLE